MNIPRPFWRYFKIMMLVLVIFVAAIVAWTLVTLWGESTVKSYMQASNPILACMRLSVATALVVFWPQLIAWRTQAEPLRNQVFLQIVVNRWHLAIVLLMTELILVQNILGQLWRLIG